MSLKECADCHRQVSTKAERCPHCGLKKPTATPPSGLLVASPAQIRLPQAACYECHQLVRKGVDTCPHCGVADPTDPPGRRRLAFAGLALLLLAVPAGAWEFGLLDGLLRLAPDPPETGLVSSRVGRRPIAPPRVKSARFPATCTTPAPVYVFDDATVPSTFLVVIADATGEPGAAADSLLRRHGVLTTEYDAAKRGFVVTLDPPVVARLRCEAGVRWMEEVEH